MNFHVTLTTLNFYVTDCQLSAFYKKCLKHRCMWNVAGPSCESFSFSVEMRGCKNICDCICKKGPLVGNANMWYEAKFARNCKFTQSWIIASLDVQCIPYLQARFETRTALLRLN